MTAARQLGNERTMVYQDGLELVFQRVFDAPRDLVWTVITDPDRITNWWGPRGYTTTVVEMDVRTGGRWRFIHHTTDGEDVAFHGEYLEVDPPGGSSGRSSSTSPGSTTRPAMRRSPSRTWAGRRG